MPYERSLVVTVPTAEIVDWPSFHAVFARVLGFPDYYGDNMDAWIDCLSYADDAESGMIDPAIEPGEMLTLRLDDVEAFHDRCPEQFGSLVECASFVNWRRVASGERPILSLALSGHFHPPRRLWQPGGASTPP